MGFSQEFLAVAFQFLMRALGALLLLAAAWFIAVALGRMLQRRLERTRIDLAVTRFAAKLTRWTIVLIAAFACLSIFDVETTSFAALIGAVGIAIGLAVQGTLSNFASGVMLLAVRPYTVGDVITAAGVTGKVYEIDLFRTTLDTADNRRFTVPNAAIFGATIENTTYHPVRRVDTFVATDQNADIDTVRQLLTTAAAEVAGALDSPPPEVILDKLAPTTLEWAIRVWCKTENYSTVRENLLTSTKQALDQIPDRSSQNGEAD